MKIFILFFFLMIFAIPTNAKTTIIKEWTEKINDHRVLFAHICIDGNLWLWTKDNYLGTYPPTLVQVLSTNSFSTLQAEKCDCGDK